MPEPTPPPITTIAWRLGHIAIGIFGARAANHFGDGGVGYETTDWPLTAAGGLALLDRHHDAWVAGVASLGAEGLAGRAARPKARTPTTRSPPSCCTSTARPCTTPPRSPCCSTCTPTAKEHPS